MLSLDFRKRIGDFQLEVSLEVGEEVLVLFGPSGSGKTSILNCIAGLVTPDEGRISLDGEVIFETVRGRVLRNVPTHRRRLGYVFQDYALFPHMTVAQNMAYGVRGQPDAQQRVETMVRTMRLDNLEGRYPRQLSGGQQQRVAIGRALVTRPRSLLLDEPFSALDTMVRDRLQRDLVELQESWRLPVVYVTHSLGDAFALGHRIAVVNEGHIEQLGPKEQVLNSPSSRAVARFTGARNIFEARVVQSTPGGLTLEWRGHRLAAPPAPLAVGAQTTFCIRPEQIMLLRGSDHPEAPSPASRAENAFWGQITDEISRGATVSLFFRLDDSASDGYDLEVSLPIHVYSRFHLDTRKRIAVSLKKESIRIISEYRQEDRH